MNPQIQIRQTFGQIGISYTPARWNIRTQPADLTIQTPTAQLSIHTTRGRLDIDQTQAFADEDLRTPLAFSEHQAALARHSAAEGTADTAEWGQRLLHIERGNVWPSWIMRYREHTRQIVPALVPRPFSVHIHYEPDRLDINASVQPVRVSANVQPAEIDFRPGQAHTYLAQAPALRIVPPPTGQFMDARM